MNESKLMFALWGDDLSCALHDQALRRRLAEAGVRRLQLNIDDSHVSRAMRIHTFEVPIAAIVSLWTSGDAADVAGILGSVSRSVAGWRVEERRPIDPPETYGGERAEALANIALIRRPAELTQEEWLERWLVQHTPIAMETQATFGYLQNVVVEPVTPDAPYVSALVEELFPSAGMDDMHAFYGSGGDDAELNRRLTRLMESVGRIGADKNIDLVPSSRYLHDLT